MSTARRLEAIDLLTQAGTNKDSNWLINDALNDPGFHLNLNVKKMQFIENSIILKRKTVAPIILSHSGRYGTATILDQIRTLVGSESLLACRTLATPPVAIVIENHVHV
jgi:hypothetical protein